MAQKRDVTQMQRRDPSGFTLIDLMLVIALVSVIAEIAVPVATDAAKGMRLGMAIREVERQLQTARLKAISANRPLRVRFNCPAVGQLRIIEVTGVAVTDLDGNRCDETRFPFPGPNDADPATPALDGPVRMLHFTITLTGSDLEFSPNGTTQEVVGGVATRTATPVTLTVSKDRESATVVVNSLGKIDIQ